MKSKRKMAVAIVAVGALVAAVGSSMYASGAQTPAPIPTQSEFDHALQVIQQVGSAYFATSTTVPATTTTVPPTTTTTTAAPPPNTTQVPTTTTAAPQGLVALHPGTSWDWQIGGTPTPSVLANATGKQKMLDVDMEGTTASQVSSIKSQGIVAICYIETGSWEDYRSDASQFPTVALGNPLDPPYTNERYLDINNSTVESLVKARIKRAADKGCQGIEPDLDDTWQGGPNGNTGFPITYDQNLAYNHRLADYAHSLHLTFGLKNAGGTAFVAASQPFTDWALNEQCNQYGECNYSSYINAGKAVFQTEYTTNTAFCISDNSRNYDGLAKKTSLTAAYRVACRNG